MKRLLFILLLLPVTVDAQIITTFAGNGILGSSGDGGPATVAELETPSGVAVDRVGNVYIVDQNGNKVRKVSAFGVITTVAGIGGLGNYSGDGGQATLAQLYFPTGVTVDHKGNIFIADQFNNAIRKIDTMGVITTVAGTGLNGYTGDGGLATNAKLWHPADVAVDTNGNVFTVDQDNSAVRKITPAGIITTIAGNGSAGFAGDGSLATGAQLNFPQGIAVDTFGNIFVADFYNSRIRKINSSGIITTIAGNGTGGYGGDGGPATNAELYDASAVAVDDSGNVYISDYYNSRIRKVNTLGIISTIAGIDTAGYSGDCGPATAAEIYYPEGVAVDKHGNVYIADYNNSRVRKVTDSLCYIPTVVRTASQSKVNIYPYPAITSLTIQSTNQSINQITITNLLGQTVYTHEYNTKKVQVGVANLPAGVYIIRINGTEVRKFVKE